MQPFYVLKNFPVELKEKIQQQYYKNDWIRTKEAVPRKMFQYEPSNSADLLSYFPEATSIEYFVFNPGSKNTPHLDRPRFAAISIPIKIDHENSFFYCGKYDSLNEYVTKKNAYTNRNTKILGSSGFFVYEPEKFIQYNLEHPIVFSTKIPHGGNNEKSNIPRIICSISYQDTDYETVVNQLPQEWF
jgi:hypothetical protein